MIWLLIGGCGVEDLGLWNIRLIRTRVDLRVNRS